MSTTLSASKRSIEAATFSHDMFVKLINDFPADKSVFQTSATDNHLLWHIGHLATTYAWFASALDGEPVGATDHENALFGMGSKPLPDAKAYPSLIDVRTRFDATWNRFASAAAALTDADAGMPPKVESGGFLKDRLDAVDKAAWHDGWHAGQVSGLRKALGLKGAF